ncbi:two-component system sensor histidine kinase CssS [Acholeplasma morum]|uniref:sensor histidine kinase n=1 Tax=Paracholeplasma morum TaxID=264637 RepID=UPI0019568EDF|nr:HAMP domain-containing sensor histidine kinase [Paracholeplasma morum]MBM7453083.1 two-component system sensor histidine kinase CssS [Paracholeplasma morum]
MRHYKLSIQVIILFSFVTFFSALVFGFITYKNYQSVYIGLARNEVDNYVEATIDNPRDTESYLGYITITVNKISTFEAAVTNRYISPNARKLLGNDETLTDAIVRAAYLGEFIYSNANETFYLSIRTRTEISESLTEYYIGIMDDTYINSVKAVTAKEDVLMTFIGTFMTFSIIILLGNMAIAIWSRNLTARIKYLQREVNQFTNTGYENKVYLNGNDEIAELSKAIENLRLEIRENEHTKQEMFQNVSHDLKTPISVIQSYAEAILDGTTEVEDAKIIIKQTEKLQGKVKMLLELSKISTLEMKESLESIPMKEVINQVYFNNKIRLNNLKVILDLDDTEFLGVREYFYTSIENLIDNATRYASKVIEVTLKNGVLTIYNDGPAIEEKYITGGFKPYEKGSRGQFGIGMSIVQKTFNKFGYSLVVENMNPGVKFTIKH